MKSCAKLLLLVPLMITSKLSTKVEKVHNIQKLLTKTRSGQEYYQLRFSMSNVSNNVLATMGETDLYKLGQFEKDVEKGHEGFDVTFDGCGIDHN